MNTKNKNPKYLLKYNELKIGDIILKSDSDPFSLKIQKYTGSNFSHVMICVENNSIIHSDIEGVFSLNPQRLLVDDYNDLKVLRFKNELSHTDYEKIQTFLREKIGSLYSIKDALLVMKKHQNSATYNKFQFCSRLVAQAYNEINYKIVENIDFCSPSDIESSKYLYEVKDMATEASDAQLAFTSTRNAVEENQKSMYYWLNKSRDLAWEKYKFQIHTINDTERFIYEYPMEDDAICADIKKSGYLENYKIEVENNPHMHDEKLFISKFQTPKNIIDASIQEFNNIPSHTNRHIKNLKNSIQRYENTHLGYYELHIAVYKALLGVSMSKFITIFNVSKTLILDANQDDQLSLILYRAQQNIQVLIELEVEAYNKSVEPINYPAGKFIGTLEHKGKSARNIIIKRSWQCNSIYCRQWRSNLLDRRFPKKPPKNILIIISNFLLSCYTYIHKSIFAKLNIEKVRIYSLL